MEENRPYLLLMARTLTRIHPRPKIVEEKRPKDSRAVSKMMMRNTKAAMELWSPSCKRERHEKVKARERLEQEMRMSNTMEERAQSQVVEPDTGSLTSAQTGAEEVLERSQEGGGNRSWHSDQMSLRLSLPTAPLQRA